MIELEKTIKALQSCSVQNDVGCQLCPYFEDRKTYGHEWCTTVMAQDALELLKEQQVCENCAMAIEDRQLVRCKDCMKGTLVTEVGMLPFIRCFGEEHELDWFCADGEVKE